MQSSSSEKERLNQISSHWSSTTGVNGQLLIYNYYAIRPFFSGDSCLELGSADGQITRLLVNDFSRVVAVDGAERFVQELRKLNIQNLTPVCSLIEELNLNEKFSTVVMAHILEHVENPIDVIKIGAKHLEDNGVLLISVPNANSLHRLAAVKMGLLKQKDELNETDLMIGHRRVYTPDLMRRHIEETGLKIKTWGGYFLKTVSNAQMEKTWTKEMMDAYYEIGKDFPENAAEIYFVCQA